MTGPVADGLNYLTSQSGASLLALLWFTAIFEIPRYTISAIAAILNMVFNREKPTGPIGTVSVVIAGHNEENSIERVVRAIREQTRAPDEIIVVSDGSGDKMMERMQALLAAGLIHGYHGTDLRAGKAAATNLSLRYATGDVVVNIDSDCTFDRHALENIVAPLADPSVGAVSGNISVRNAHVGLLTMMQSIEYLIGLSLEKHAADFREQVVCASGAFAAFRATALDQIQGLDVGGGEDLDVTLRLRKAGWRIRFAHDAVSYTEVPETWRALVNQRLRWDRDALRLRFRKHLRVLSPFSPDFRWSELLPALDYLVFQLAAACMLPFYVIWLVMSYADLSLPILMAATFALFFLDLFAFCMAALAYPKLSSPVQLLYLPGLALFYGTALRIVRLYAYVQELVVNASVFDEYVPAKVRLMRKW
ncbi:glycosyltransferase [Tepidamorphus sp. 3E244]|uniref:glycosyltransferase n=1 Tax=Tepidamorphus sp. 3E244 TaxID=3385498 RepID=UPI0038FC38AC